MFIPIVKKREKYYYQLSQKLISSKDLKRLHDLRIPPAYKIILLARKKNNNIQVIATDTQGKKQYFYKKQWIENAKITKYKRLFKFIKKRKLFLTSIKNIIKHKSSLTKLYVINFMFLIMDITHIRIGNIKYLKNSMGLTTLNKKNCILLKNGNIKLSFIGKSHTICNIVFYNKKVYEFLKRLKKIPGKYLFQYTTPTKGYITSSDMNFYLQKHIGAEFSCKDFRTYAANKWFVYYLQRENDTIPKTIKSSLTLTAKKLNHTTNTAKESYILNSIITEYSNNPKKIMQFSNIDKALLYYLKRFIKNIN